MKVTVKDSPQPSQTNLFMVKATRQLGIRYATDEHDRVCLLLVGSGSCSRSEWFHLNQVDQFTTGTTLEVVL